MSMHIVYTIGSLKNSGGVERVLVNKANYLSEIGYKVTLLIAQQDDREYAYKLSHRIRIIHVDINKVDDISSRIPILGFFIKIQRLKKVYQRICDEIIPDIIINVERGYEDFILHQLKPHIPCIRESHLSLEASVIKDRGGKSSFKNNFFTYFYNRQLRKFDNVVLLTEEDRRYRSFANGKVVIPNLVSKFSLDAAYSLQSKKAISVGRLDQFKNFRDQILIWKTIVDHYPDWTLEIYGEGPEKNNLQNMISELDLQSHVFLRGKSSSVEAVLQSSAFFVFTSIAEGFGMVLVEAMQMGLPVVAYRCPCGPGDIITHGEDGFLVEVGDRAQFTAYALKLIEDQELRERMSAAALRKSDQYSAEVIMPRWISLFKSILHEKA